MSPDLNKFVSLPSELLCLSCLEVLAPVTVLDTTCGYLFLYCYMRNFLSYPLILYIPNPQRSQLQPWKPISMSLNLFLYCVNLLQPILVGLFYCEKFPLVPCIVLSSNLQSISVTIQTFTNHLNVGHSYYTEVTNVRLSYFFWYQESQVVPMMHSNSTHPTSCKTTYFYTCYHHC